MSAKLFRHFILLMFVCPIIVAPAQMVKQNPSTTIVSLKFISPNELVDNLIKQKQLNDDYLLKTKQGEVKFLVNKSTNQILLTGDSIAVREAKNVIEFLDVAPRQIVIEATIVELNNQRMAELGIDWQKFLDETIISMLTQVEMWRNVRKSGDFSEDVRGTRTYFAGNTYTNISVGDLLKIIKETGIGKITNIPKITTINNKTGVLLDGSRVTYVARYSSYANIYETSELTAGLYLEVTPSLGENDYLRLDVKAKLTTLGVVIGGSPSEFGQHVENTVIVKNGQEFLLGSFKKTEKIKIKRKMPILGTILPFLFSRTAEIETYKDFLVILKPQVIDLNAPEPPKIEE